MYVIDARNVNDAYAIGMNVLKVRGVVQPSRYGETIEHPSPVCTVYRRPTERVLFDSQRDCNPFFHLFESLWMLAGRNDVEFPAHYAGKMREFSDDGKTFHGAYGFRWRKHFDMEGGAEENVPDQIETVIRMLKADPDTRRAVISMWDPVADLGRPGKDFPCNTQIFFKVRNDHLNMTVCNRSNDAIWGTYGANAVHMSVLQEYIALATGNQVGTYRQVSDSFHAYTEVFNKHYVGPKQMKACPYELGEVHSVPLFMPEGKEQFDLSVQKFCDDVGKFGSTNHTSGFIHTVAEPLRMAWEHHKRKNYQEAVEWVAMCLAPDWRRACTEWLMRRKENYDGKSV